MARANNYLAKLMSNYFAPDAAFNPLLHLWYLSIMLQVYAVAALAIPLAQRMKKRWIVGSLGGAACVSFGWLWHTDAYYDTLPRIWEILAGGLVCLLPQRKRAWATAASAVSLGYILLCGLGIVTGIIPAVVASTVLLIRYLPESHLMQLLSNRPLQWIGKISFSLYLVHMPLFVYWRMWLFGEVGVWDEVFMLIAAVLLEWLYYQLVEKRRPAWWVAVAMWLCALALSYAGRKTHGFKNLIQESAPVPVQEYTIFRECTEAAMSTAAEPLLNPYCDSLPGKVKLHTPLLWLGDGSHTPNVLLIGDSHASHLYAGMNEIFLQEGYSGLLMSTIVLPFKGWRVDWNDGGSYFYNPQKEEALPRWLEAHPQIRHVIITQRWIYRWDHEPNHEKYANDLRHFLQTLKKLNKHAIIIGPTPEYGPRFTREDKYGKLARLRGIQRAGATVNITQTAQQYLQIHAPALSVLRMLQDEGLTLKIIKLRLKWMLY